MMNKKSFQGGVREHTTDDSTRAHGKSERCLPGLTEHFRSAWAPPVPNPRLASAPETYARRSR